MVYATEALLAEYGKSIQGLTFVVQVKDINVVCFMLYHVLQILRKLFFFIKSITKI